MAAWPGQEDHNERVVGGGWERERARRPRGRGGTRVALGEPQTHRALPGGSLCHAEVAPGPAVAAAWPTQDHREIVVVEISSANARDGRVARGGGVRVALWHMASHEAQPGGSLCHARVAPGLAGAAAIPLEGDGRLGGREAVGLELWGSSCHVGEGGGGDGMRGEGGRG